MSQEKLKLDVHHMELAIASSQEELARQGEELEALEKTYGVWVSCKQNKLALVYSTITCSLFPAPKLIVSVLAAYSCAAAWVSVTTPLRNPSSDLQPGLRLNCKYCNFSYAFVSNVLWSS